MDLIGPLVRASGFPHAFQCRESKSGGRESAGLHLVHISGGGRKRSEEEVKGREEREKTRKEEKEKKGF